MLSLHDARQRAEGRLLVISQTSPDDELVINEAYIAERNRGWIFPYNTKLFLQTHLPTDGLVGNGPLFVDKVSGNVYVLPSGGWRSLLDAYDKDGIMPSFNQGMRWVGEGKSLPFPKKP